MLLCYLVCNLVNLAALFWTFKKIKSIELTVCNDCFTLQILHCHFFNFFSKCTYANSDEY